MSQPGVVMLTSTSLWKLIIDKKINEVTIKIFISKSSETFTINYS